MIKQLLGYKNILMAGGLSLMIGYTVGYIKGEASQAIKNEREVSNAVVKLEENKREVMSLDDIALRSEYCQWVRDDKQKCLSANIPIGE